MVTVRVGQAASLLGVHPRTIRRWMGRGLLPYVILPSGQKRIPGKAIKTILFGGEGNVAVGTDRPEAVGG